VKDIGAFCAQTGNLWWQIPAFAGGTKPGEEWKKKRTTPFVSVPVIHRFYAVCRSHEAVAGPGLRMGLEEGMF
jgi:hypothetical protein